MVTQLGLDRLVVHFVDNAPEILSALAQPSPLQNPAAFLSPGKSKND